MGRHASIAPGDPRGRRARGGRRCGGRAAAVGLLFAAGLAGSAQAAEYVMRPPVAIDAVRLHVELFPDDHRIVARAELDLRALDREVAAFDLWLNRDFRIADLRPVRRVTYRWRPDRDAPPFAPTTRPLRLELAPPLPAGESLRLELFYSGSLPRLINGVNVVGPDLVELSLYSGWFPRVLGAGDFELRLEVEAPAGMTVLSLAEPTAVRHGRRRSRTRFDLRSQSEDVVLLAAPGLEPADRERDGFHVRVWHRDLDPEIVSAMLDEILRTEQFYRRELRLPPAARRVEVFASPRPGWNYSRPPLLIVSAESLRRGLDPSDAVGRRNLRTLAHELAHCWWHLADHYTYDDWLNEGLAEYSAWRATEPRLGEDSSRDLLGDYLERVRGLPAPLSIAVTLRSDPEAETLFFAKAALVLRLLAWVMGDEAFLDTLAEYHRTFASGAVKGDTVAFRRIAESRHGGSLIWFFQPWVYDADLPQLVLDYEVRSAAPDRWRVEGKVRQPAGAAIRLPVEVVAVGPAGERGTVAVEIEGTEAPFSLELAFPPARVELDPERRVPRRP